MQDFWLDIRSVLLNGVDGYGFGARGGHKFLYAVDDLCILGFLDYVGYSCHGWDYDYEVGKVAIGFSGPAFKVMYVMARSGGVMRHCKCRGLSSVVRLDGLLYFDILELEGDVRCWVVSRDVVDYLGVFGVRLDLSGGYLDLSSVDMVSEDYTRVFKKLYGSFGVRCCGQRFVRWLFLDYLREYYDRLVSVGLVRDIVALNREYMDGVFDAVGDDVGFLSFVGYICHGWDYDYSIGSISIGYPSQSFKIVYCMTRSWAYVRRECRCIGLSSVVRLEGLLYFNTLELMGAVSCWVLSVDVMEYLRHYMNRLKVSGEGYLDLREVDEVSMDYTDLFKKLFYPLRVRCYGRRFTRWLFVDYLRGTGCEASYIDLVLDTMALNREFMQGVFDELEGCGDEGYLEWLRGMI